MRLKSLCILLLGLACASADAAVLHGHVVKCTRDVVQIAVDGSSMPQAGDEVEVYVEIPGLVDTAWVCSAQVTGVDGNIASAQVTDRSADPRKDDLAQITTKRGR